MNRQPYGAPPRWWPPKLDRRWVRLTHGYRLRKLRREQQIERIDVAGLEHIAEPLAQGAGVLLAPNHSTHYDSAALYLALDRIGQPAYLLTAWQVFAMATRFERWFMQRMGCFSIDREGADRQAFAASVDVLCAGQCPLVVFPEGDIYHASDRVFPFREGAAAIALAAARKEVRPIVATPCAIKFFYVDDPTPNLHRAAGDLERRVLLRPRPDLPLARRVHRIASAVLSLKELDYLGSSQTGRLRDRVGPLLDAALGQLETRYGLPDNGRPPPERVKRLRQAIVRRLDGKQGPVPDAAECDRLAADLDDIFFVTQLFSYPADYLAENPSVERLAETIDKLQEDVLGLDLPTVHGRRRVAIQFGQPLAVTPAGDRRDAVADWTDRLQASVQTLLDALRPVGR